MFLKKILTVFLLCSYFVLSAEKLELKNPLPVKDIPNFVETKLPAIISVKNPLFKGTVRNSNTISGISIHRISWSYNGIPVVGRFTVVKEKDGNVINIVNGIKDFSIDTKPALSPEKAAAALAEAVFGGTSKSDFVATTAIIPVNGEYKLAYRIRFRPENPLDGRYYFVDANDGRVLRSGDLVKFATNKAKVFEFNPIRTPDPIEVTLPWLGNDANGKLSAAADSKGLRKVVVANCPDLGETYRGYPRCTVRQLANKDTNGSFIYEDWENGLDYKFDTDDIYPEVSLYYHTTKIYKYLSGLGLSAYTELPNHRGTNPIVGIANFQQYSYDGSSVTLQPYENAHFAKYDSTYADYYKIIYGDFYTQSDHLVFGQSEKIDYAYDGDVVYHEFGHGVVSGIAEFDYTGWPDEYGFSNEIKGMDEGMADVFSFIISEDPCLAEYLAKKTSGSGSLDGFKCLRKAKNENRVNEDFIGEGHEDGLPLVGAHWEIYQKMLDSGFTKDDFAKIFLTALLSVPSNEIGFKEWGELMLDATAQSSASALKNDFKKILTDRGYFNEIRARNVKNSSPQYFFFGGIGDGQYTYSKDTVYVKYGNSRTEVGPMYLQLYYDVPQCVDTLTISGTPLDENGGQESVPQLTAFVRENEPVIWNHNSSPSTVKYDKIVTGSDNKWVFNNLEPGKRYYFHFINTGVPGILYRPKAKASWSSDEECTVEPEENDDDPSDTDPGDSDSGDTADSGSSDPDSGDSGNTDSTDSGNNNNEPGGNGDNSDSNGDNSDSDDDNSGSNDESGSGFQPGELGGECYRDNTCDEGLVCNGYICIEAKKSNKKSGGCSVLTIN